MFWPTFLAELVSLGRSKLVKILLFYLIYEPGASESWYGILRFDLILKRCHPLLIPSIYTPEHSGVEHFHEIPEP